MKGRLMFLFAVCAMNFSAFAQTMPIHSVSARLGVPVAITYKTYTGKKEAWEFGLGSVGPNWGKQYYINSFNAVPKYKDFKYLDHQVQNTVYLLTRYVKEFQIHNVGMPGAWTWYCGVGGVFKISQVTYRYTNTDAIPPTQTDKRTDMDFGPEVILGAEYWLEDTPLSFYGEFSGMLEVFDRVGGKVFAAVGVRFHFLQ